ncbi:MAG: hypothetical protein ACXWW0_01090, partial [Bacteroidia bacterium]
MRKIILLCVLLALQVFSAPLFAQMVAPILELPASNDTAVSTSPLLQTSNHGDAKIEFEVDSVSTFNSPGKMVTVSLPNNWGDKEQGRVKFLQFNKKYYWRGRSAMDGDTSPWSSARSFRTVTNPILSFPANNSTNGLSAFGWKDAGSLTYTVQLDTTDDFSSPFAQNIKVTDTVFPKYGTIYAYAPKLLYGKKHYWRVLAFHKNDTSVWTEIWNFTLPTKTTLKSPATNTIGWQDYVTVEWNSLWDAKFYQLAYDTTADFSSAAKKDTILTKTYKLTLNNLYFDSKHYWRVRAIYAGDTSDWSDTWNFSTDKKAKLSSPYNNSNNIELNEPLRWTSFSSGGGSKRLYELQADTSAELNSPKLFIKFTSNLAEILPDKMFSTTYFWRVRIINLNDTSEWTDTWKFKTRTRDNAYNLYPYDKTLNASTSLEFTVV